MKELISIIVPVYNVEKYLNRCIESIVNQTYKDLEIILIDDGSTDSSGEICDKWTKTDERIKVIHKENGGVSSARNVGLDIAKGEYIGFVDSDDYIEKSMYAEMYEKFQMLDIELVLCEYNQENELEDVCSDNVNYGYKQITKNQAILEVFPYKGAVWRGLFKKRIITEMRFDEEKFMAEDLKFLCQYILKCNANMCLILNKLYNYVQRDDGVVRLSISKTQECKKIQQWIDCVSEVALIVFNKEIDDKLYKNVITVHWQAIEKLLNIDKSIAKNYQNNLKKYKKYFSLKDKIYYCFLCIDSRVFQRVYNNIKYLKRK